MAKTTDPTAHAADAIEQARAEVGAMKKLIELLAPLPPAARANVVRFAQRWVDDQAGKDGPA